VTVNNVVHFHFWWCGAFSLFFQILGKEFSPTKTLYNKKKNENDKYMQQ